MDCEEARNEFSALLDGELTPDARDAVEAHLALCADCLREVDGLKRVDTLYRGLPAQTAPPRFEDRVAKAIRPSIFTLRRGRLDPETGRADDTTRATI